MKTLILSFFALAAFAQAGYAPRAGGVDQSNVAITGGTINGVAIGGTTPAAASVTSLNTNGLFTAYTNSPVEHVISNDWSGNNTVAIWNKNSGGLSATRFLRPDGKERAASGYAELGTPFDTCYYIETSTYLDGPVTAPATVQNITRPVIPIRFVTTGVIGSDFAFYNRGEFRPDGLFVVNRAALNGLQTNSNPIKPVWEVGSASATGATAYLYNAYTDTSNYERAAIKFTSNVLTFGTEKLGTGSTRSIQFEVGGTSIANFSTAGHLLWNTDNTYDIGQDGATRPRDVNVGRTLRCGNAEITGGGFVFATQHVAGVSFGNADANNFALIGSEGAGRDLRLIYPGVAKMDVILKSGPSRVEFTDTDNSSAVPLTVRIDGTKRTLFGGPATLKGYTVATLPTGTTGDMAYVTDALAPSFLTTVTGGGSAVTPVFYNGTNWVAQ